jgi:hypothetical protein
MEGQPNQQQGENGQPNGNATGQQAGAQAQGQQGNGGSGDTKTFTQAELDAIVKDRLDRERKAGEAKALKEREAADAKALEDQKEFQKLAEQRQTRITELEPYQAKSERYEAALKTHLDAERKNLPAHITALLDKLDPADQLEWIASNREAISTTTTSGTRSVPPTGRANGQANGREDDAVKATRQQMAGSGRYRL